MAYNATNITTPIYDSNTNSARDSLTGGVANSTGVHFDVPTVANGMVYAGTGADANYAQGTLVGYGLLSSYLKSSASYFSAPAGLTVSATNSTTAHLAWTSHSALAAEFRIDRSPDGKAWTTVAYVSNSSLSYNDTIAAATDYYYRVVAISGASATAASNTAHLVVTASQARFNLRDRLQ